MDRERWRRDPAVVGAVLGTGLRWGWIVDGPGAKAEPVENAGPGKGPLGSSGDGPYVRFVWPRGRRPGPRP